jgi:hypothetical protein
LDYFAGGVPSSEFFRGTLEDIREISTENANKAINRIQELCFIGALSYFEAFCKDHFASLINIEPSLTERLKSGGQDVTIDAAAVALYGASISHKLGFLVAEKHDFGTAQKINALYTALLKITPFSKDEARIYSDLLRDRNLLVHHGGTYTMTYLMAHPTLAATKRMEHAFWNSLFLTHNDVITAVSFLGIIARKMTRAAHGALSKYVENTGLSYDDERKKALHFLLWWGDEEEAEPV